MFLVYAVLASLAIDLARALALRLGGRPFQVQAGVVRWWPALLISLGVQAFILTRDAVILPAPLWILAIWGGQVVIAAVVMVNLRRPWMPLVAAGVLLNLAVMTANGGMMPTTPEAHVRGGLALPSQGAQLGQLRPRSKNLFLPEEQTRLAILSDRLVVPWWRGAFSIGDVLIAVGAFMVLQAAISPAARPAPGASGTKYFSNRRPFTLRPLPWST